MRRLILILGSTLAAAILTLTGRVSILFAELVVGDSPTTYNTPSATKIKDLGKQLSSGAITFAQYEAGYDSLVHNVTASSDRNAINTGSGRTNVIDLGKTSIALDAPHGISPYDGSRNVSRAEASVSTSTQGLCAAGYIDTPLGDNLDLCEQKVLISSATQSYLTNSYTLFNGVPELFKHYSYTLRGIDTSFEFGVWEQFTSTAHYANFFVASQDQADNIVQQAKANSWLVTFQGKNSQGLYQVQVVVQAGPTGY